MKRHDHASLLKEGFIGDLLTVSEDEPVSVMVERRETGRQVWGSGGRPASEPQHMANEELAIVWTFETSKPISSSIHASPNHTPRPNPSQTGPPTGN